MNKEKHPVGQILVFMVCVVAIAGVCILVSAPSPFNPASAAPVLDGPVLSIASQIPSQPNSIVTVPVVFTANGTSIASVVFSIDYDQTWLLFDNTVPNAITLNLPAGFQGGCVYDLSDTDGEIDCTVMYPTSPFQSLPDGELAVIKLRTLNPPYTVDATVGFSTVPSVSFGNTQGQSEPGTAVDGSVRIEVPTTATVTPTPTKTQSPTITPTPTTTRTPTPTPTGTVTLPVVGEKAYLPLILRQPMISCTNLILNGGFEEDTAWEIPATEYSAAYSTAQQHTGARSMRTGIDYYPHNRYSYSSARQLVTIPTSFDWVRLYFWRYAISSEATDRPESDISAVLPPEPRIGLPFGDSPLTGYDAQYVLILDANNNVLETLVWMLVNQPSWIYQEFLLDDYAGRAVKIQFGTYNDGYYGISAMYVDDVSIEVCQQTH